MTAVKVFENIRQKTETVWARRLLCALEYGIAAVLLLQCNTAWMCIAPVRDYIGIVLFAVLCVCVLGCILLSGGIFSLRRLAGGSLLLLLLFSYLMVLFFAHQVNRPVFWRFTAGFLVLAAYQFFCYDGGISSVLKKYSRIVVGVAAYSLVMWLLCTVLEVIPSTGFVMTSWNDTAYFDAPIKSFFGIYFEAQVGRNTSIFTEAPMAALQYGLAALIALLQERPNLICLGVLALAILSTTSTMGYLILLFVALILGYRWVQRKGWLENRSIRIAGCIALGTLTVGAVAVLIWKLQTTSGSIRSDDFAAGFRAFGDRVLLGHGFNFMVPVQQYMSEWRHYNIGFSSGLLYVLANGGLWLGALHVGPAVRAVIVGSRRRQWQIVWFALGILVILLITVFQYTYLLNTLLLFLLTYQPLEKLSHSA